MRNAIDYSYARPSADEVAGHQLDILVYTGPARPEAAYLADMRAKGVAVTLIQESAPNRAQQGYNAGVMDAHYADSRADQVGYPVTCSIAYVVSDGSAGDPNYGADNIAQYARGIQDSTRRPFFFYGNQYAVDAAMRGAPHSLGTWVPSTWGRGTLLNQEPNIPSPVADSDFNTVHASYGAWGQSNTQGDTFTMSQMDDIANWEKDTRKIILNQLIGDYKQGEYPGILAQWEKDTRKIITTEVAKQIAASEARIIAAINAK